MSSGQELIEAYLDDSLTVDQAAELQVWLQADDENVRQFVLANAREEQLREVAVANATLEALATATDRISTPCLPRGKARSRSALACAALARTCSFSEIFNDWSSARR